VVIVPSFYLYGVDQTRYGKSLHPVKALETGIKVEEASFNSELLESMIVSGIIITRVIVAKIKNS
jgi:hypothetical protein